MIHKSPKHSGPLSRFREAVLEDGPLDIRDQVLVRLTIALTRKDPTLLASARRQAREVEISDAGQGHLAALVALYEVERIDSLAEPRSGGCCG
jgi:hypothetical protein